MIELVIMFIVALVISVPPMWFLLSVAGPQVTLIGFGIMVWFMVVLCGPGILLGMYYKRKGQNEK